LDKAQRMNSASGGLDGTGIFPDNTFLTNLNALPSSNASTGSLSTTGHIMAKKDNLLNEDDTNAIADEVMQKVVKEMNLVATEDFDLLEEYIKLPTM